MTSTLPALWTSAPTTGFSVPVMASTMAMKLSVSENVILSLMVRIMRLESAMRCGLSDKRKACFVDDHLRNRWKSARPQKEKIRSQYTFYEYLKG